MGMTREEFVGSLYRAAVRAGVKTELSLIEKHDFDNFTAENDNTTYELVEVFPSFVLVKFIENESIAE